MYPIDSFLITVVNCPLMFYHLLTHISAVPINTRFIAGSVPHRAWGNSAKSNLFCMITTTTATDIYILGSSAGQRSYCEWV